MTDIFCVVNDTITRVCNKVSQCQNLVKVKNEILAYDEAIVQTVCNTLLESQLTVIR